MWSKIIDPRISRISRRWLLRPCTGCKLRSAEAYIKTVCTPSTALSRWVTDVKAGHSPLGRRAVVSAWPLMRNWDHGRSYCERRERCERASFPRKMRDIIVVGDPLISDGRSGSHPAITYLNRVIKRISGRTGASLWFRRYTCGFSVAQLRNNNASCCRHATTVRRPATEARRHIIGRSHVALHGRPCSSFDSQRRNSAAQYITLETAYFVGRKNSLFYDRI